MWLTNDFDSSGVGEHHPEEDQRIKAWVLHRYREKHPPNTSREVHLSTCDQVLVAYDLYDGLCDEDACSCRWVYLEATLSCSHGVRREFEDPMAEAGDVEGLLAKLMRYEMDEREQRAQHVVTMGKIDEPDAISMIVVYRNPSDHPGKYVARQHDIGRGRVAVHPKPLKVADTLDEVRDAIPGDMMRMPPSDTDDPCIVEIHL